MAKVLTVAKRWRGTVRASITKFDAQIVQWESEAEHAASDDHTI